MIFRFGYRGFDFGRLLSESWGFEFFSKLIESMGHRYQAVIDADGWWTKYVCARGKWLETHEPLLYISYRSLHS